MDQSSLEIKKYIDNLVPVVKTAVLSPEWRKRVGEIGQKFSLHLDQISSLEYEVLFVLIGMEPEEDLVSNIQRELNVSSIIAGQIGEEVNTRVFQYILKLMQAQTASKPERFEQSLVNSHESIEKTQSNVFEPNYQTRLNTVTPLLSDIEKMAKGSKNEIRNKENDKRPENNYHSKEVAPPMNLPGAEEMVEKVISQQSFVNSETKNTGTSNTPTPIATRTSNIAPLPNFADTKLNTTVTSTQQTVIKEDLPAQAGKPLVKSYSADPYREPIE